MGKKKKILFHSNHCKAKTGFGRNAKTVLKYLAGTGKYEIIEYSTSTRWGDPNLDKMPWKTYGCLPSDAEWNQIQKDPGLARAVQYGAQYIDEIIKIEKPDVYIGVEDIWAFSGWWNKPWWNKVNTVLHTTLDSLPILPLALEAAAKTPNFYVWGKFAEREMNKLGHENVKTLHGAFDTENFHRLSDKKRNELRQKHGITHGAFIIGFVFRNQLRKSVPQLLEGFKLFLDKNPNAYLFLHTCWHENPGGSWNIPELIDKYNIPKDRILTTYICRKCGHYHVKSFSGEALNCQVCGEQKSVFTTSVVSGVTEEELNEVYNLMDVYCHPFTSGGQEMPLQESKLTELITCTTNYSCGEEYCTKESGGLPLDWIPDTEVGTIFTKARTLPKSIFEQLSKVYSMSEKERKTIGRKAKKFALKKVSIEEVGKQWEEIIDNLPEVTWDFDFTPLPKNPNYQSSDEKDDVKWLQEIYINILGLDLPEEDKGLQYWMKAFKEGTSRDQILNHFRGVAVKDIKKENRVNFADLLDKDDKGRRIALVMPESAGDVLMAASLLEGIKDLYPNYNIYFITKHQYMEVIEGNPFVHKVLPYVEACENILWMEGNWDHEGFFEICYLPFVGTQRHLNYLHNRETAIGFNLRWDQNPEPPKEELEEMTRRMEMEA